MDFPTYCTPQAEALPTGTYIALFHGRKDVKSNMDDMGFYGPMIGPIRYAHTTYASEIKICMEGDEDSSIVLPIVEGCVELDGKFYGDWIVMQHIQRRAAELPVTTDRRKQ